MQPCFLPHVLSLWAEHNTLTVLHQVLTITFSLVAGDAIPKH